MIKSDRYRLLLTAALGVLGVFAVFAAFGVLAIQWHLTQPVDIPVVASKNLPCVSYAPFRRVGETPFSVEGAVSEKNIEDDLNRLRSLTRCIRTYGVGNGLEHVPRIAKRLGFEVRLGVWLGKDEALNQRELNKAIELTRQYPGVVTAMVVGNEVLLRQDLSAHQLQAHLVRAKAEVTVPVTYADVWEFWRKNAGLANHVDWVTIHVLPYWEDQPVGASQAAQYVISIAQQMKAEFSKFSSKPIWVGETGWPVAGRQRGPAAPGVVEQIQLIRQLSVLAPQAGIEVNYIEAFDQPWKRALEGAMGSAWGLFDSDGQQRFNFDSPKIVRPYLGLFDAQIQYAQQWSQSRLDLWQYLGSAVILMLASVFLLVGKFAKGITNSSMAAAEFVLLFVSGCWALMLLFDPRYRGFPIAFFVMPAIIAWMRCAQTAIVPSVLASGNSACRLLAVVLTVVSVAMLVQEGWQNRQALLQSLLWCSLALPSLLPKILNRKQS